MDIQDIRQVSSYNSSISELCKLSNEELLLMLIPEEERHSLGASLARAKGIYNQCLNRFERHLVNINTEYSDAASFVFDLALVYAPVIGEKIGCNSLIPVLAVLFARTGLKKFV